MSLPRDILFAGLVSDMEEENDSCPLIKTEECTFAYIKVRGVTIVTEVVIVSVTVQVSNVYIVATTRSNTNIAMLFSLLHRVTQVRDWEENIFIAILNIFSCQVLSDYFKEVEEESIRDNFVICYELLDEMVDFGYPQTTDAKILQEYITQVRVENNRMPIYCG